MDVFVADERIIVTMQGLRWIQKSEYTYQGGKTRYSINVQYKGSDTNVTYDSEEERDRIYNTVVGYLKKQGRVVKVEKR